MAKQLMKIPLNVSIVTDLAGSRVRDSSGNPFCEVRNKKIGTDSTTGLLLIKAGKRNAQKIYMYILIVIYTYIYIVCVLATYYLCALK
jgi:hypothetical protein